MNPAESQLCPACRNQVDADSRFCKHCAHDLKRYDSVPIPPPSAARFWKTRPIIIAGSAFIIVTLAVAVVFVYRRSRSQASPAIASTAPTTLTISDPAKKIEDKILRNEAINDDDISNLSAYDLRVLRNVHFARYGRKYDQYGELGGYFYSRPWYKPSESYSDGLITETDKANINLIVAFERAKAPAANLSSPTPTQDQPTTTEQNSGPPSLELQAIDEAERAFDRMYKKCSDHFVVECLALDSCPGTMNVDQVMNPMFSVGNVKRLTSADGLNGIEWSGVVVIGMEGMRRNICNGGWSRWSDRNEAYWPRLGEVVLTKQNAVWRSELRLGGKHRPLPCSKVPR